jgi:hypothetical protein
MAQSLCVAVTVVRIVLVRVQMRMRMRARVGWVKRRIKIQSTDSCSDGWSSRATHHS